MTPLPVHGIAYILFSDAIKHLEGDDADVKNELIELSKAYREPNEGDQKYFLEDFLEYVRSYINDEDADEDIERLQVGLDDWVHDMENEELVARRASHIKFDI